MRCYCLLACLFWPVSAATVVVNTAVPVDSLSQTQLRSIFSLRQTQWPDGSAIRVLVLPEHSAIHQQFSRKQLRLFPYQLNTIWDKHSFSGTGRRPQQVEDVAAMLEAIQATPGAIGYLEQLTPAQGIKEVHIE